MKDKFINDLKNETISDIEIVEKYISFGNPYIFKSNENLYYELKKDLSAYFNEDIKNIIMIGSAKLGFSIAPHKLWKEFNDESDLDIVIISEILFDKYWKELFEFNIEFYDRSEIEQENYNKFLLYFFKGWLRPDLFPQRFYKKNEWFDYLTNISYKKYGPYKITGAIFKNTFFFNSYHSANIKKLRKGAIYG